MWTMVELKEYKRKNFIGLSPVDVKSVLVRPFYIPAEYKELQYVATMLLEGCKFRNAPIQFAEPSTKFSGATACVNWRTEPYIFAFQVIPGGGHFVSVCEFSIRPKSCKYPGMEEITSKEQLVQHLYNNSVYEKSLESMIRRIAEKAQAEELAEPKGEKMEMKKGTKPRIGNRLVFTYIDGTTYTVRGLKSAQIRDMTVQYTATTVDAEGNVTNTEVRRIITNEMAKVVVQIASGGERVLLDLRPKVAKEIEKPTRKRKTREEYEAEQAQKKAALDRLNKAEQLLREADKLMR